MKKIEFNDLVNSIIEEAPITKYLTPAVKYGKRVGRALGRAAPSVARGVKEIGKGLGSVLGAGAVNLGKAGLGAAKLAGKAALNTPEAIRTTKKFIYGDRPSEMIKQGIKGLKDRRKAGTGIEQFDKNIVKTMIANQLSDITAKSQKQDTTGGTSTASTQVQGQATGGTASPAAAGGTSTSTTTTPTSMMKPAAAAIQREPKTGDVFNVYGDYGRITRYKVTKVHPDHVEAKKV